MSLHISDLIKNTELYRDIDSIVKPDKNDASVPASIFRYNPVTWEEPGGVWHTLLGSIPEEGIWTMGTTPLESMIEFDKELQLTLKNDGTIVLLPEAERQKLHKKVFDKIGKLLHFNERE